eukprot:CAMPEP_0119495594 /NCGR_PEP_ID=MMETSP1344-20130328/19174_1 /TAXON_ID=236787 /ORGANISM="Florenciella parvula, Strain CCMP2471" /LENGTH=103 /DNA_ID=CAMNT_0007531185 /DNA_START=238 /DNA_END=546 /DNA_ORIENTATION=+
MASASRLLTVSFECDSFASATAPRVGRALGWYMRRGICRARAAAVALLATAIPPPSPPSAKTSLCEVMGWSSAYLSAVTAERSLAGSVCPPVPARCTARPNMV